MRTIILPLILAIAVNVGVLSLLPITGRAVARIFRSSPFQTLIVEPPQEFHSTEVQENLPEETMNQAENEPKSENKSEATETDVVPLEQVIRISETIEQGLTEPLKLGVEFEPHLRALEGTPVQEGLHEGRPDGTAPKKAGDGKRYAFEAPVLIESVKPLYPVWASEQGMEGTVIVKMLVDTEGRVIDVEVVKTSGYRILDEAAIEAVKQYKFLPSKRDGHPVKVWVEQEIIFKIER